VVVTILYLTVSSGTEPKGVQFSGKQFVAPSATAAARPVAASAAPAARSAAATPDSSTVKMAAATPNAPPKGKTSQAAKPQSILKQNTAPASSTPTSSTTRLQHYAVIKTLDHIFRIRLKLPIETKSGSPNDTALTAFQQWYSAFAGEVQSLHLLP